MSVPLPARFGVRLDPAAWVENATVLGGTPFRIVRLAPSHEVALASWLAGEPVGHDPYRGWLARALVSAGLAQPVPPSADSPAVSVVIPVRNRPHALDRLLRAVRAHQGTDPVAEVIVVDDASVDPAAHARAAAEWDARLVRRPVRGGAAAARNDGAAAAGGDVLAFVDSDCVPRPGWLSALTPHFADPLVAAVAPRIVAHTPADPGRGPPWLARYEAARAPMDRGPTPARVVPGGPVPFVATAALLVRASAFGRGFDATLHGGEDVDLVWRLTGAGLHVRYEPAGEVEHEHRTAVGGFLSRRAYYGRTAAPLARRHPGAARPLAVSPWTAAAWAALGLRSPLAGAVITAAATGLLARELRGTVARPVNQAVRLAGGGTLRSGLAVADAVRRSWWPLSAAAFAAFPRIRPALAAAALLPDLLDWRRERPDLDPVRWVAARRLDDAAYGLGVWHGCRAAGVWDPLRPDLGWKLRVMTSEELIGAYRGAAGWRSAECDGCDWRDS